MNCGRVLSRLKSYINRSWLLVYVYCAVGVGEELWRYKSEL